MLSLGQWNTIKPVWTVNNSAWFWVEIFISLLCFRRQFSFQDTLLDGFRKISLYFIHYRAFRIENNYFIVSSSQSPGSLWACLKMITLECRYRRPNTTRPPGLRGFLDKVWLDLTQTSPISVTRGSTLDCVSLDVDNAFIKATLYHARMITCWFHWLAVSVHEVSSSW